jgi:GNAT superfamily N-acetyltransferase
MPPTLSIAQALHELHTRFGTARTLKHAAFRLVNRFLRLDCLHIIVLDREHLQSLEPGNPHRLSVRSATLDDLRKMERQGGWDIDPSKIELFQAGDTCLLSYVDHQLAGYTWAHTGGCPELVPGFRLRVPREYLYNFAAFTLPAYRGCGLQSFRHHALLHDPRWGDKKGLLGFVIHTNYSSQRGQGKSGYRRIGDVWLLGTKSTFYTHIGKNLRMMGIKRIRSVPSQRMPGYCPRAKGRIGR